MNPFKSDKFSKNVKIDFKKTASIKVVDQKTKTKRCKTVKKMPMELKSLLKEVC